MEEKDWPPINWISSRRCSPEAVTRREKHEPELVDAIGAMQTGDEIRRFSSPLYVQGQGYVIMRNGKVIAAFQIVPADYD